MDKYLWVELIKPLLKTLFIVFIVAIALKYYILNYTYHGKHASNIDKIRSCIEKQLRGDYSNKEKNKEICIKCHIQYLGEYRD